jgi:hypothetical protein
MLTYPITVITRAGKGSPLNVVDFDQNQTTVQDAINDLRARLVNIRGW